MEYVILYLTFQLSDISFEFCCFNLVHKALPSVIWKLLFTPFHFFKIKHDYCRCCSLIRMANVNTEW